VSQHGRAGRQRIRSDHARLAALGRWRPGTNAEAQARVDLLGERAVENVKQIAALAPPLSAETLDKLAAILLRRSIQLGDGDDR
jgi:hypothetical protein